VRPAFAARQLRAASCFPPAKTHFAPSRRRVKACGMSNDSTRQRLIGTWKLIAAVREEIASGAKTELLGAGGRAASERAGNRRKISRL
jgi:hypothetical protein